MHINHDMCLLNSSTLLNAQPKDKLPMKFTYLRRLKLPAQRSEIKQAMRTLYFTSVSSKEVPGRWPRYSKKEPPHLTTLAQLQPSTITKYYK
jgi:hypothetical protein